ncbi:hypothetical protein [Salinifilum ghardaiensis]
MFDEWFHCADFEGCLFINVLLETGPAHPLGQAGLDYLADIRTLIEDLADQAGLAAPEEFAHSFHLMMKGAIIAAAEGDQAAAGRAQLLARSLIAGHCAAAQQPQPQPSRTHPERRARGGHG